MFGQEQEGGKFAEKVLGGEPPQAEFPRYKACELTEEEARLWAQLEAVNKWPNLLEPLGSNRATLRQGADHLAAAALYWLTKNHGLKWVNTEGGVTYRYEMVEGHEIWVVGEDRITEEGLKEMDAYDRLWAVLKLSRAIARTQPQPGADAPGT